MEWFDKYSPQEQRVLFALAVVCTIFLLVFLVIKPVYSFKNRHVQNAQIQRTTLNYVQRSAQEAKSLRQTARPLQATKRSVAAVIEGTLKKFKLPTPKNLQPSGHNKAFVMYDSVNFNRFITALDELSKANGIYVSQFTAKTTGNTGLVSLNVNFERTIPYE